MNKFNYNKYGIYPMESKYDNLSIINNNNFLEISPLEYYRCGNLNDKIILEKRDNNKANLKIKVLNQPITSQKYFDNYFNYPIKPNDQPMNAIEKWQKKQPLSFSTHDNMGEYPINSINIYDKLINKYDNPYIYKHTFFNQQDARIQINSDSQNYIQYKKNTFNK